MSHRPGRTVFPRASTWVASRGIFTVARGPAAAMRPFSIKTTESGTGSLPVPSIRIPPTRAIESERLASPDQSFDRVAMERLVLSVDADCVLPARLDLHAAGRKRGEFGR